MPIPTFVRSMMLASTGISALAAMSALAAHASPTSTSRICHPPTPDASTAASGYGTVHFSNSCSARVQPVLQLAIARLHSFEDADFAGIAKQDPGCAIAWWGAAMAARGNPLGGTLDANELAAGRRDVDAALAVTTASAREKALIGAMDVYYRPYPDQKARARAYADKMDGVHAAYPDDPDIAALDGLAIIEGVDLNDATHARQKRAGAILEAVMRAHPEHPGAPHYLIHAYDYTALAPHAVHAAEIEATLAPASSHAQHMPAHIWSMLGAWDKSIAANRRSGERSDPTVGHDPVKGDTVYQHAFDFIAYARLQKGEDRAVAADLTALKRKGDLPTIGAARYALERGDWRGAAAIAVPPNDVFDAALARFTRAYGAARAGDVKAAKTELRALEALRKPVAAGAGEYWGIFVDIYAKTAHAWLLQAEGKNEAALQLMSEAAAQDDGHEKHIYLENKILPMRESLGDMALALGRPREALAAYTQSLQLAPNRYRSFLGAAQAAQALGDQVATRQWWSKLLTLQKDADGNRPGIAEARSYLAGSKG